MKAIVLYFTDGKSKSINSSVYNLGSTHNDNIYYIELYRYNNVVNVDIPEGIGYINTVNNKVKNLKIPNTTYTVFSKIETLMSGNLNCTIRLFL